MGLTVSQLIWHKASRGIASMASTVVVEDLNIRGMSKSARGTAENPGRHLKAKSGLNREIMNMGWHGLVQGVTNGLNIHQYC